jgi:predicted acetyltransferase
MRLGSSIVIRSALQVRPVEDDEVPIWMQVANRGFHQPNRISPAGVELRRRTLIGQRPIAALDGGQIVGTFRSYDVELPVPGAAVPANAVSTVTVAASHRRRGALTAMMTADLTAARERGAVLSVLLASEAPIYGRFGFGPATEECKWTLDAASARFRDDPVGDGLLSLELVEDGDLAEAAPAVYAAAASRMPGAMPRDQLWWQIALGAIEVPWDDPKLTRPALLVRDRAGQAVGTASYRAEPARSGRRHRVDLQLLDLTAPTPAAHLALWRALAELDLVETITAPRRASHDPLPWLLADRRAARQSELSDFLWVRLLDVAAALRARRYAGAGRVVLEVIEPGGGRERLLLNVEPTGSTGSAKVAAGIEKPDLVPGMGRAEVSVSTDEPDVVLEVGALGSAYLGQVPLYQLHAAGQVTEHTPGAVAALGALLAWTPTAAVTQTSF